MRPDNGRRASRLLRKLGVGAAIAAFWLAVWEGLSRLVAAELLLPSPRQVAAAGWRLVQTAPFWHAASLSLLRIVIGFVAAVAVGSLLAMCTARSKLVRSLTAPLLHVVRAAPVASFIILALVWLKTNRLPTFISFLMVLPVVWSNVEQGIRETDPKLLEMAQVYRLSRWNTFRLIRLPSVMPYALAAMRTGLGFAWKSGIAAEVICRPKPSVGGSLYDAKLYLETPEVFVWTAAVVLLSVLLEQGLLALTRRLGRRYNVPSDAARKGGA
ncbi:MAG: ABC transporter permease [Clostridia bacterium]|nr:ABC transporter permease [Clostridia bacterium]